MKPKLTSNDIARLFAISILSLIADAGMDWFGWTFQPFSQLAAIWILWGNKNFFLDGFFEVVEYIASASFVMQVSKIKPTPISKTVIEDCFFLSTLVTVLLFI